jgi:hypothetical protein
VVRIRAAEPLVRRDEPLVCRYRFEGQEPANGVHAFTLRLGLPRRNGDVDSWGPAFAAALRLLKCGTATSTLEPQNGAAGHEFR